MLDLSQVKAETEAYLKDSDYWLRVMNEINSVVQDLYLQYEMTEEVKKLVVVFYKIKIKVMEDGLSLMEKEKNLSIDTSTHPDIIERYANRQLEIERAKEELVNFILKGELPDF